MLKVGDILKVTSPMSYYCNHCDSVRINLNTLIRVDRVDLPRRVNFSFLIDQGIGHIHCFTNCTISVVEGRTEKFS